MKIMYRTFLLLSICLFLFSLISCEDKRPLRIYDPSFSKSNKEIKNSTPIKKDLEAEGKTEPIEKDEQEQIKEESAEEYEDDYTECEEMNAAHKIYIVCRPLSGGYYYFPRLRGDHWGVGRDALSYFSTNNAQYSLGVSLWRSSYGAIAPMYDQYGNALDMTCSNCVRGPYYDDYSFVARYFDDGLYYYENGYWSDDYAYSYFTSPGITNRCGYNNQLSSLMKSITNVAMGSLGHIVYNILDVANQGRYGCPQSYNFNICYNGK